MAYTSEQNSLSKPTKSRIKPRPLFDSLKALTDQSVQEFEAERPAVRQYLNQFPSECCVDTDLMHVRSFLKSYSNVPTTFRSYRGQIERLLLWCWIYRGKSVLQMVRSDAEAFMDFTLKPDPDWIGDAVRQRFVLRDGLLEPNELWRPFGAQVKKATRKVAEENDLVVEPAVYNVAQKSMQLVMSTCSSFFDFLMHENISAGNPVKAIKQKSNYLKANRTTRTSKSLTQLEWDYLIDTAELMANENPKHERTLFIVVSLFAMYLRVSDIVGNKDWTPTMGSFVKRGNGWWYEVVGKGNVEADITVKPDYLPYLTRYRESRNLTPFPHKGETTPLLTKNNGVAGITDRYIRTLVQKVFDRAREKMKLDGFSDEQCQDLMSATLHWLRHTGATFDAPYRSTKHLQMDLRHSDMATTVNTYYNSIDDERASSNAGLGIRR